MRKFCFAVAFLAVAACDSSDPSVDVDWLAQGTGIENEYSLSPVAVGSRSGGFSEAIVYDALFEHDGRDFVRGQWDLHSIVPSLGSSFVRESSLGLELWYTSLNGWLKEPALIVPATVRVGMQWRVSLAGTPYEFEVMARNVEHTLSGELPVWIIRRTHLPPDCDSVSRCAEIVEQRYIEGFGQTESSDLGDFPHTGFVQQLEPRPPARYPTLTATAVEPYPMEAELLDNLRTTSVSFVRPTDSSTGTLIVKGYGDCQGMPGRVCLVDLCFSADGNAAIRSGLTGPVDTYLKGNGCVIQRFDGYEPAFASDASGAVVTPDDVYWVPRERTGHAGSSPVAIFADPDSLEPRLLSTTFGGVDALQDVLWGEVSTTSPPSFGEHRPIGGQWASLRDLVGPIALPSVGNADVPPTALSLAAPGQAPEFALLSTNKFLTYSKFEGNTLSTPTPVAMLSGQPSVTTDQDGQHLLLTSPDGRIDRIVAAEGNLVPEAIGRVTLPAGEELVAAVDLSGTRGGEGKLLIATFALGEDKAWTTRFYTTAKQAPVRWNFPPALGVIASDFGADVIVCWPTSTDDLDPTGWTIAGVPAKQVLPFGQSCAHVVRDVVNDPTFGGQDLTKLDPDAAFTLFARLPFQTVGPVPGVGKVHLGVAQAQSTYDLFTFPISGPFAPLSDGGYVSLARLYSPTGAVEGVPAGITSTGYHEVSDRGGAGLWMNQYGAVRLIGREGKDFGLPPEATSTTEPGWGEFASAGGGLVISYMTSTDRGWFLLDADGNWTKLPPLPEGGVSYSARTANGILCGGTNTDEAFCIHDTGALLGRVALPEGMVMGGWVDLPDGTFLIGDKAGSQVLRFDPSAQTATPWGAGLLFDEIHYDANGRAYGVVDDGSGERVAGRITAAGLEPIDISEWKKRYFRTHVFHGQLVGLMPGPDRLWVLSYGCQSGACSTVASPILWP